MSQLKKLASHTAIYGLSSVLGRAVNFLLVPFYTTEGVLEVEEYGMVTELYAFVAFLNILYAYGLETAYFRFASDEKIRIHSNLELASAFYAKNEKSRTYFNLAFTSILFSSLFLSLGITFSASDIAAALEYPNQKNLIIWLAWILAIDAVVAIPFARLRKEGKAMQFAIFKFSNICINILLNIFFLVFCPEFLDDRPDHWLNAIYYPELKVGYVFLSNLIANGLYLLFFFPLWLKVRIWWNKAEWKKMMQYAWPILIIGFTGITNEMFSRVLLKYRLPDGFYSGYTNLEALGIFGACYKLSIFMALAIQAFRYAFEPFFFARAEDKNSPQLFSRVMTWFVIFASASWLIISILLPYLAPLFLRQKSYLEALGTVPWLLGGGLFLGIYYNLSIWYKLNDKTIYGAYIALMGCFLTFLLNWMLIPTMGYMGSALTTF
ncbi:MAG: oligosaccharide flippase family protein, partial [Bacteroidota bacterium]